MVHLTENQSKVMDYILFTIQNTGLPPTLREISAHFGWSAVGSAQDVVSALRKKGLLQETTRGKSRQILPPKKHIPTESKLNAHRQLSSNETAKVSQHTKISPPGRDPNLLYVPLLGSVQAGLPLEAHEIKSEDLVPFPWKGGGSEGYFCVNVEGYSMMNVGFLPGDLLLVESTQNAKNGDIVLASIGTHEVTVKRFAMRGSHIYRQAAERIEAQYNLNNLPPALLVPENADFAPLAFGAKENDKILGLVRSLYRTEIN
jgi:repressor LexA